MSENLSVLEILDARVKEEHDRLAVLPSRGLSPEQRQVLVERLRALAEVRQWIVEVDADAAGVRDQILVRANRIRDNCLRLAEMYEGLTSDLEAMLPHMNPEAQNFTQMLLGVGQVQAAVLRGFAAAVSDDEVSQVEQMLQNTSVQLDQLKQFASGAIGGSNVQ